MENTGRNFKNVFKFHLVKMFVICLMTALKFYIKEMKGAPRWVLTIAQIQGFNIALLNKGFTDLFTKEEQ